MSEFISAETNIPAPTTEEILQRYGHIETAVASGHVARFEGPLRPDTPEEAELRAKALAQAQLDFRLEWDKHTEELAAQRPKPPAEVIPIGKNRPQLARGVGQTIMIMNQAS